MPSRWLASITALGALSATAIAGDVLKTTGFTTCLNNAEINVDALDVQFDRSTKQISFNVGGTSSKVQNVTASMSVSAYGKRVYQKDFNPCDEATKVAELCPGMPSMKDVSRYTFALTSSC